MTNDEFKAMIQKFQRLLQTNPRELARIFEEILAQDS